jgi:hypothetical protein
MIIGNHGAARIAVNMPLTAYEKVRDYRRRKRNGRRVLRIEVNVGAVADLLIDSGFLRSWDDQDPEKVRKALQAAIEAWST